MLKSRFKYIETNMTVYPNGVETTITITGKYQNQTLTEIIAYTNNGHQYHLTIREEIQARNLIQSMGEI